MKGGGISDPVEFMYMLKDIRVPQGNCSGVGMGA